MWQKGFGLLERENGFYCFKPVFLLKKKKKFGIVKEKFWGFFSGLKMFQENVCFGGNAILIKIERFSRELKMEIQLNPFAPDPSCEMLTDCGYSMGLLPSVTTWSSTSVPGISYWLYQSEGLETAKIRNPKLGLDIAALV